MDKYTLDLTRPVQTRDGRKARVFCTDFRAKKFPLCGAIDTPMGEEPAIWTAQGGFVGDNNPDCRDLINVPEERFVNVYSNVAGREFIGADIFTSKGDAEDAPRSGASDYVGTYRLVPA